MASNVSIIGAGLSGLMCAIKLARRGFVVEVFEKRSHQEICLPKYNLNGKIGRSMSIDISARGIFALKEIGIYDSVFAKSVPMANKIFHLEDKRLLTIPYGRDASERILSTSRTHLYQVLYKACQSYPNISINFGYILQNVDVNLRLLNFIVPAEHRESQIGTDILIGADGINSKVREFLEIETSAPFKKSYFSHSYKELTIPKNKLSTLDNQTMHLWPRNEFMLVAQPNFDCSFTCALIMKNDNSIHSFRHLENSSTISEFFHTNFSDVAAFMPQLADEYRDNPIGALTIISGTRWTAGDFILVLGDAAHGMVPFFGQGVNCSFEDCTTLAQLLDQNSNNWPLTMKMFNAIRVPDANAISAMSTINYPELLEEPDLEKIILEKQIELILSREFSPYRSYHNLVCFDRIPYATIEKVRNLQKKLLSQLAKNGLKIDNVDRAEIVSALDIYNEQLAAHDVGGADGNIRLP